VFQTWSRKCTCGSITPATKLSQGRHFSIAVSLAADEIAGATWTISSWVSTSPLKTHHWIIEFERRISRQGADGMARVKAGVKCESELYFERKR